MGSPLVVACVESKPVCNSMTFSIRGIIVVLPDFEGSPALGERAGYGRLKCTRVRIPGGSLGEHIIGRYGSGSAPDGLTV
jgi:hypothetical protein